MISTSQQKNLLFGYLVNKVVHQTKKKQFQFKSKCFIIFIGDGFIDGPEFQFSDMNSDQKIERSKYFIE